jgi:hypothetical protein
MNKLFNCHKTAGIITGFALSALFLVQDGQLSFFPNNCINRTGLFTGSAFDAFLFRHFPKQQILATVRRAALVINMSFILMAEIINR